MWSTQHSHFVEHFGEYASGFSQNIGVPDGTSYFVKMLGIGHK